MEMLPKVTVEAENLESIRETVRMNPTREVCPFSDLSAVLCSIARDMIECQECWIRLTTAHADTSVMR